MTVTRAKFHVMADHHHCGTLLRELSQNGGEHRLKLCVQALCRLVEQQYPRAQHQQLGERDLLHLAAREVKRVPRGQLTYLTQADNRLHTRASFFLRQAAERRQIPQRFPNGAAAEKRLRVLRKQQA